MAARQSREDQDDPDTTRKQSRGGTPQLGKDLPTTLSGYSQSLFGSLQIARAHPYLLQSKVQGIRKLRQLSAPLGLTEASIHQKNSHPNSFFCSAKSIPQARPAAPESRRWRTERPRRYPTTSVSADAKNTPMPRVSSERIGVLLKEWEEGAIRGGGRRCFGSFLCEARAESRVYGTYI